MQGGSFVLEDLPIDLQCPQPVSDIIYAGPIVPIYPWYMATQWIKETGQVLRVQDGGNIWDDVEFDVPVGAATAEVRLYYQQTSWEYVQFLWLENDTLGPFLGQEGINFLDAWANTGMSPPYEMSLETLALESGTFVPLSVR